MRCSATALATIVALGAALGAALAGCSSTLCGRTSECPSGQVCTAAGVCAIPPDAAEGSGDGGSAANVDGAAADATPDASAAARVPIDNEGHEVHGVHGVP